VIGETILRRFVVVFYVIAFTLSIVGIFSIPQNAWQLLSSGEKVLMGFNLLVGFCGVLLAYFVYVDGEDLKSLQATIRRNSSQTSEPYEELVPPNAELSGTYVNLVNQFREKGFIFCYLLCIHPA
jgi:hypothetical protein